MCDIRKTDLTVTERRGCVSADQSSYSRLRSVLQLAEVLSLLINCDRRALVNADFFICINRSSCFHDSLCICQVMVDN